LSVHREDESQPTDPSGHLRLTAERLWTDCVTVGGLQPDTEYVYSLWRNAACDMPVENLDGLRKSDLRFKTLPADNDAQIDFLMMSCHNPTVATQDGNEGYGVWADIPQIIGQDSNKSVRFALLVGDQVYADKWKDQLLSAPDHATRLKLYLQVYREFWSNIHYRRVLCALPAMMIWDDHDIFDGWGSTADSYESKKSPNMLPNYLDTFKAASEVFRVMQVSRNPPALSEDPRDGYDCCFRMGKWGFVLLDLRTNRNFRLGRLMHEDQAYRIRNWVEQHKADLNGLFVISPVVFTHAAPSLDAVGTYVWPWVMWAVDAFAKKFEWGKGLQRSFNDSLGDIRDDIGDSWGAPENNGQTDMILDFLFEVQNDKEHPLPVVILSGDIHTSGYANVYSSNPEHAKRASIPHITSSSVAYVPFNWILEAVYRHATKTVKLGGKDRYTSQVSHHFCNRSVAVLSIRSTAAGHQLKVKYYLENYPEPQILLFDLDRVSHREHISWASAHAKLFSKKYEPQPKTANLDKLLAITATASGDELDVGNSVVDLMKALGLDSSLGTRKELARKWGYSGRLVGSAEMNTFVRRRLMKQYIDAGGNVPESVRQEVEQALETSKEPS
jgi:hypothetical protein